MSIPIAEVTPLHAELEARIQKQDGAVGFSLDVRAPRKGGKMTGCDQCESWDRELREVKEALRKLDSSEARGYEYSAEHDKLEQRRTKLWEALESHRSHRVHPESAD